MNSAELEEFFKSNWANTVRRHKSSLEPEDREVVNAFSTSEQLVDKFLSSAPSSVALIRPALGHLKVFVAFFEANTAPGSDVSYLWGSLACLLKLVSRKLQALDNVPRMIKSLALKAEAFNGYSTRSPVVNTVLREVCFDIQLQLTDFITVSITHIRYAEDGKKGHPSAGLQQRIQTRYETANAELGEALSRLEKPGAIGPSTPGVATIEAAVSNLAIKQRCIMLPHTKTNRLFDRLDVFVRLDELLTPDAGEFALQSVALHGLSGVGKTSIASSYAQRKFAENVYDVVLWVFAANDVSLRKGMTDIAVRLKLPGAQSQSHDENQILVQDWFNTTECKWLVIFDAVESANVLAPYWPRGSRFGRAIITSLNRSLEFDPAVSGIEIASWDAQTGAEFLLFLLKKNIGRDLLSESTSALTLSEKLSGHALALQSMAGMIYEGEFSVQEFTAMYLKDPRSAHAMDAFVAIFEYAFRSLDKDSFSLLGILSFLLYDHIPPEIFDLQDDEAPSENLEFLRDRLKGFSEAQRNLTKRALIKRDKDSRVVTVHPMVQTQFRHYLKPEQRQKAFNDTVSLVSNVVPKSDMEKGQLYDSWPGYDRYLKHVINLRDIFDDERRASSSFEAPPKFCEMLVDYQRVLYEQCAFEECERTCAVNRIAASTLSSEMDRDNLEGAILSHQSQVTEIIGDPYTAMKICQQEIDIRLRETPRKEIIIAYSTCNLGLLYSTANDFPKALECLKESRRWWVSHFRGKGEERDLAASILVYEARCMIGLNEYDKAEKLLDQTMAQLLGEEHLNFGSLAYTHFCYGTLDRCRRRFESAEAHFIEAQNTWRNGDQSRLHPLNAGMMYKIGACCLDQGEIDAAIKHLKDSMVVTEFYSRTLPVEHGRNLFKLSEALAQNGEAHAAEADALRDKAEYYLRRKKPDVVEAGTEAAYDALLPIFWK